MKNILQVLISAENRKQANKILSLLLKRKLVIGGLMVGAPAKFWWKGEILQMKYYNIFTFALSHKKMEIISEVRKASVEEVPMVVFSAIEGNKEFNNWIIQAIG